MRAFGRRALGPAIIFVVCAAIYVAVAGARVRAPSPNNHFAHLANAFLHGQLHVVGNRPPGFDDWACFDTEIQGPCAPGAFQRPRESYRWYVSFPPVPAILLMPAVAILGVDHFSDPLFWAIFAGLAPALLFVLLRRMREEGKTQRSRLDDLTLVALFAFGSVFFYVAVQGSVWFSAHVVVSVFMVLFAYFGLEARNPLLAGLMLGLCFWTRPSTSLFAALFLFEAMRVSRPEDAPEAEEGASIWRRLWVYLKGVRWRPVIRKVLLFSAPILVIGGLAMWMNSARFGSPFEFGHTYLQIRWRTRIERWGLFNFHYLAKNLAVFWAALPWLSAAAPYIMISRHGVALWVTSPNLLPALWPKKVSAQMVGMMIAAGAVALLDLCYQNSGWVQFGYRFSLDYMVILVLLLALSGRRFGWGFRLLLLLAIAFNLFGAITFNRAHEFYDRDGTQNIIFQPD